MRLPRRSVVALLLSLLVGRLPGVGKVTEEKLKSFEIQTVAELRKMHLSMLERRFGRYGVRLYELARRVDKSEVIPDRPTQSVSAEDTFRAGCAADRDRADDPSSRGEDLEGGAQGIADRTHRGPQTEDKRVQDSHA